MKSIEFEDIDKLPGIRIKENDTFCFRCHPEVECFNRCCRNLNLFLYPYDVLRLKESLGLSSDEFLDRYVDIVMRPANFLNYAHQEVNACALNEETFTGVDVDFDLNRDGELSFHVRFTDKVSLQLDKIEIVKL